MQKDDPIKNENTALKEALEYLMFFPKELKKELENKKRSSSSRS